MLMVGLHINSVRLNRPFVSWQTVRDTLHGIGPVTFALVSAHSLDVLAWWAGGFFSYGVL